MRKHACLDHEGNPIPWYTYPAIEYVKRLDVSDKRVFEYGAGYSTLFWACRCKGLAVVEDNESWFRTIAARLPKAVDCRLVGGRDAYVGAISQCGGPFDIIAIDGKHREECARAAVEHLAATGFVILDNAERYSEIRAFLRGAGLIEVDMAGFGPINGYVWTTSFFLRRAVDISYRPIRREPCAGH